MNPAQELAIAFGSALAVMGIALLLLCLMIFQPWSQPAQPAVAHVDAGSTPTCVVYQNYRAC